MNDNKRRILSETPNGGSANEKDFNPLLFAAEQTLASCGSSEYISTSNDPLPI
ncbi:hypothetical protein [Cedecea sp. FDAARGOS_727]|uniref:hypothetical protein n=1 Tax=Cedecea TaxID=158483 RepID=UPI00143E4132|nr:hypothetical protein [Cedecea sp. FDAARGOS_727]QIX95762.1 hypothetical protein FOC35_08720 [Cedecea sp. FDAARGOS_727]